MTLQEYRIDLAKVHMKFGMPDGFPNKEKIELLVQMIIDAGRLMEGGPTTGYSAFLSGLDEPLRFPMWVVLMAKGADQESLKTLAMGLRLSPEEMLMLFMRYRLNEQ